MAVVPDALYAERTRDRPTFCRIGPAARRRLEAPSAARSALMSDASPEPICGLIDGAIRIMLDCAWISGRSVEQAGRQEKVRAGKAARTLSRRGFDAGSLRPDSRQTTRRFPGRHRQVEAPGQSGVDEARLGSDLNLHRNKRSITLDLKHPHGVAVFKRLIRRPPTSSWRIIAPMRKRRLGIDYETLSAINPHLCLREHIRLRSGWSLSVAPGLRPDRARHGRSHVHHRTARAGPVREALQSPTRRPAFIARSEY